MLCDAHVHIGQFYDIYTTPQELASFLHSVGIDVVAISSTTTCEENYEKVIDELTSFIKLFHGRVIPVLWITPSLLKDEQYLSKILACGIPWKCIKIHPQLSSKEWNTSGDNYLKVLYLSKFLKTPIIIHTGVVENCHPLQLQPLFCENSDQLFIMAHGRPIDETISVMKQCPNTFVDTAFMPTENILSLVNEGFVKRILWGTDYPIIKFYERNINYCKYYNSIINELKESINEYDYKMITGENLLSLYRL